MLLIVFIALSLFRSTCSSMFSCCCPSKDDRQKDGLQKTHNAQTSSIALRQTNQEIRQKIKRVFDKIDHDIERTQAQERKQEQAHEQTQGKKPNDSWMYNPVYGELRSPSSSEIPVMIEDKSETCSDHDLVFDLLVQSLNIEYLKHSTYYANKKEFDEELRSIYKRHCGEDQGQQVMDEYQLQQIRTEMNDVLEERKEVVKEWNVFRLFDQENKGYVDKADIARIQSSNIVFPLSDEELDQMVKETGTNGKINFEQFREAMNSAYDYSEIVRQSEIALEQYPNSR